MGPAPLLVARAQKGDSSYSSSRYRLTQKQLPAQDPDKQLVEEHSTGNTFPLPLATGGPTTRQLFTRAEGSLRNIHEGRRVHLQGGPGAAIAPSSSTDVQAEENHRPEDIKRHMQAMNQHRKEMEQREAVMRKLKEDIRNSMSVLKTREEALGQEKEVLQ